MAQGKVSSKSVNLRDKPDLDGKVLVTLGEGTLLEILGEDGDWLKVGLTGFVNKKFVSRESLPLTPTLSPKGEGDFLWQNPTLKNLRLEPEKLMTPTGTSKQKQIIATYNQYGNLLRSVSAALKMDVGVGLAIMCVESGGVGFKDGKMIIRFEPHWFHKLWGKANQPAFDRCFKFDSWKGETHFYRTSDKAGWQGFHGNQAQEWAAFELARGMNDEAAKKSISMGLGQIMGFNHKQVGYDSAAPMFNNFNSDVRFQILGMFDFMTPEMKAALAKKDFTAFAKSYNGSGQAASYGKLIADNVSAWAKLTS